MGTRAPPPHGFTPRLSTGRRQMPISQLLPGRGVTDPKQSGFWSAWYKRGLWFFPLGHWWILAHWQPMETTKNKESACTITKFWETIRSSSQGVNNHHFLDKTSLSTPGKVAFLSNMKEPTQVKGKEELKEYVVNKRQNKSPEISLNKTQINDLLNREFKIMKVQMLLKVREQCMDKVRISAKR